MKLIYTGAGCVEPIAFSTMSLWHINPGLDKDDLYDVWGKLYNSCQQMSIVAGRVAGSRVK